MALEVVYLRRHDTISCRSPSLPSRTEFSPRGFNSTVSREYVQRKPQMMDYISLTLLTFHTVWVVRIFCGWSWLASRKNLRVSDSQVRWHLHVMELVIIITERRSYGWNGNLHVFYVYTLRFCSLVFTARCTECKARYCCRKSSVCLSVCNVDVPWAYIGLVRN